LPDYLLQTKTPKKDKYYDSKIKYVADNTYDVDLQASLYGKMPLKIQGSMNIGRMSDRRDLRDTKGTRFVSRWYEKRDGERSFNLKKDQSSNYTKFQQNMSLDQLNAEKSSEIMNLGKPDTPKEKN